MLSAAILRPAARFTAAALLVLFFPTASHAEPGASSQPLPAELGTLSRAERASRGVVYVNYVTEPDTMDVTRMVSALSYGWLGHMYEGLLTYDSKGNTAPGQAESMSVSADGTVYTFKIRPEARWQDGKPVTAADFVFAWQRLVDPTFASDYAFMGETARIQNAGAIVRKEKKPSELGVKATDDRTLEVKLDGPVPFFPRLMAFQVFYPLRKDVVEKAGNRFATDKASLVGNGPYALTIWQHERGLRMEKWSGYWNAKAITMNVIEAPIALKDKLAELNVYRTGGLDLISLAEDSFRIAAQAGLASKGGPDGSVTYLEFNARPGRLFADKRLREAVRLAANRRELINKVIGLPGDLPAFAFVPHTTTGSAPGKKYRAENPFTHRDGDLARAKELVRTVLKEKGLERLPAITLLASDSPNGKRMSEYFQQVFSRALGTEVRIDSVAYKARAQKQRDGDFDITPYGWVADYDDPQSFLDLFASGNGSNHTGWNDPKYDALIARTRASADNAERMRLFAEAEKYLVTENSVVAPLIHGARRWIDAPGLLGVSRANAPDPDFRGASWNTKLAQKDLKLRGGPQ